MFSLIRYRVSQSDRLEFEPLLADLSASFSTAPGWDSGHSGLCWDDSELWALVTTWKSVADYRRALSANKLTLMQLMRWQVNEPSAYDNANEIGENLPRDTG